jgi:hypothetical protein
LLQDSLLLSNTVITLLVFALSNKNFLPISCYYHSLVSSNSPQELVMATIRIVNTFHPTRSHSSPSKNDVGAGIYSTRNISRPSLERGGSRGQTRSIDRRNGEEIENEDLRLRQAGDFNKRQV